MNKTVKERSKGAEDLIKTMKRITNKVKKKHRVILNWEPGIPGEKHGYIYLTHAGHLNKKTYKHVIDSLEHVGYMVDNFLHHGVIDDAKEIIGEGLYIRG